MYLMTRDVASISRSTEKQANRTGFARLSALVAWRVASRLAARGTTATARLKKTVLKPKAQGHGRIKYLADGARVARQPPG